MLSEEQLIQNYEKFKSLLLETGEHRKEQLEAMIDHFGDRLVLCPASSKKNFHNCFPGGLVEHSLRVLKNAKRMIKVTPDLFENIPDESVVFAALLHDFGKIGSLEQDRYVIQQNDYYLKKGNLYEINNDIPFSTVPHSTLFIIQHFGVKMTFDEFQAILLNDGFIVEENRPYCMKETKLSLLIHQADRISCEQEKTFHDSNHG